MKKDGPTDGILHESAIDQANILVDYLNKTPTEELDLQFVKAHVDALSEFARQAKYSASNEENGHGSERRQAG